MNPMELERNLDLAAGIALATFFATAQVFAATAPSTAVAAPKVSAANVAPATRVASTESCSTRPDEILYTARFGKGGALRLIVGRNSSGKRIAAKSAKPDLDESALVAQVWSGGTCQASCTEALPGYEKTFIQMNCQGGQLPALNTTLALFREKASLRFGTWLRGYQDTPLLVELDRLGVPARKPAPQIALAK